MKDAQIKKLLAAEKARQKKVINLIASENYVSADVLVALGSELTNKYSEGYPGARYYGGNEITDKVESLARERALKTFGLKAADWHINVQPLSGSPANVAVYLALVPPGGKIMGMSLDQGGHLTHGHKVSITGKMWKQVPFGVDKTTERIDFDVLRKIALAEKPDIIVAGFTAYPRVVDFARFRQVADAAGALLMVDMSHFAGLVAGKQYPSPFAYADIVTTTVHKTLRGPRAALIFARNNVKAKRDIPNLGANGVKKGEMLDLGKRIDRAVFPGMQGGPHQNQIAAVAVALREAASPAFKKYALQVKKNAAAMAAELARLGWRIVSGGTETHLILVDTWMEGKGDHSISGKDASDILERIGIIVNKNAIPFDARPPADPSGIRLGSAAETTRGRKERDFVKLAQRIDAALRKVKSKK